jgi:hypothetical protein
MAILKGINLTVSFLLELMALAIFGVWGFTIGESTLIKILLGVGAPVLMIVFWAIFMAPRSVRRLQDPWHVLFEIVIFGAAGLALLSIGRSDLAFVWGVIVALNILLSFPLKQRPQDPSAV